MNAFFNTNLYGFDYNEDEEHREQDKNINELREDWERVYKFNDKKESNTLYQINNRQQEYPYWKSSNLIINES